jgi:hypothetical protein
MAANVPNPTPKPMAKLLDVFGDPGSGCILETGIVATLVYTNVDPETTFVSNRVMDLSWEEMTEDFDDEAVVDMIDDWVGEALTVAKGF